MTALKCLRGAGGGTRTLTGLPPTDFRTSYGFRRRHKGVCGLDYTFTLANAQASALGAARLVSTPSLSGLARGCHLTGFPDFEQFCVPGFPRAHSNDLQVRCVYHSATPAYSKSLAVPPRRLKLLFSLSPHAPKAGEELARLRLRMPPDRGPIGARDVGDAAVALEELVGHLEDREHQSAFRAPG